MFICSKCCRPFDKEPKRVQTESLKDGSLFTTKFCDACVERIDRDPGWQFTCTDWSSEEKKYKTVSDWQKANLKLKGKK